MPFDSESVWVKVFFTSCDETQLQALTLVTWEDCLFGGFINGSPPSAAPVFAPNPFSGTTVLQYQSSKKQDADLMIYSSSGQLIYSRRLSFLPGMNKIKLEDLPQTRNGVEYYQIISPAGVMGTGKLLQMP